MPITLKNGDAIKFDSSDGRWGYYATDNQDQINAFLKLQSERRGGVFAIDEVEYERDYVKKKESSTPFETRSNREGIGGGVSMDTMLPRAPSAPAAAVPSVEPAAPVPDPAAKPVVKSNKPNVGRRTP